MSKKIDDGERIEMLRISMALSGISCDSQTAFLLMSIFEEVQKKGGKFSIEDAVRIKYEARKRYEVLSVKAVTDAQSTGSSEAGTERSKDAK